MEDQSLKERRKMVDTDERTLSIREQSNILQVNRSSLYYKPKGETDLNLKLMRILDELYLKHPTYGVRRMQEELRELGYSVNHKRVRRLLRLMRLEAIYPKKNLSKLGNAKYIYPYLLEHMEIDEPNKVWAIDITYIPMHKGFMYLTAIIDVYSRYIVGWSLSNTLDKEVQVNLLEDSMAEHGRPEVINSDQGSQFTSELWTSTLKDHGIRISMDGKGRALDNVYIERFFRTLKQDHVYLNPASDGLELYKGIDVYMKTYNKRKHQGIEQKPEVKYKEVA